MSTLEEPASEEERVVDRFTKYLNGKRGKTVLQNLEEGESFLMQTSEHLFRVTKRSGRAVVKIVRPSVA